MIRMRTRFLPLMMLTGLLLMASFSNANAREPKSSSARIDFVHKYNDSYNCSLSVRQLKNMSRLMPANLKKEIGMDYLPMILAGLRNSDNICVKDVSASIAYIDGNSERFEITLQLPKATIYIRNANWEELGSFFDSVI